MNVKTTTYVLVLGAIALFPVLASAQTFVPLTSLPGIEDASGSPDIATLLNNMYRLAIGVAALIAIVQIIRGGIKFMTNQGSFTANAEAKKLISQSIFGLILVLSPAVIFGVINPKILDLSLDFSAIKSKAPAPADVSSGDPADSLGEEPGGVDAETGFPTGSFLMKLVASTQTEVENLQKTKCEVPTNLKHLIDHYNRLGLTVQKDCLAGGANECKEGWTTAYIKFCEAIGANIRYYAVCKKEWGTDACSSPLQGGPKPVYRQLAVDQKNEASFKAGCSGQGKAELLVAPGTCTYTEAEKTAIKKALGETGDVTIECKNKPLKCAYDTN